MMNNYENILEILSLVLLFKDIKLSLYISNYYPMISVDQGGFLSILRGFGAPGAVQNIGRLGKNFR